MEVTYRVGRKEDSQRIAELISVASGGVTDFLCRDVRPGMTPVAMIADYLAADSYPYSYASATLAECRGMVAGMALSYPSDFPIQCPLAFMIPEFLHPPAG